MNDYTDIINMERPPSSHPKMDLGNRAKLFSSFDALRGFDLALLAKQVERQLTVRASLLDDAQELLDRKLHVVTYEEHSLTAGSTSQAIAYVGLEDRQDNVCWGAGIDNDIIDASLNALLSAANRLYEVWQSKEK